MKRAIDDIEHKTKMKVCAVVSDNPSNMTKSWGYLKNERKDIICNGCSAHAMNSILEKVFTTIPEFMTLEDESVAVAKFVKKRVVLLARFRAR
jgi:hypothetical protein